MRPEAMRKTQMAAHVVKDTSMVVRKAVTKSFLSSWDSQAFYEDGHLPRALNDQQQWPHRHLKSSLGGGDQVLRPSAGTGLTGSLARDEPKGRQGNAVRLAEATPRGTLQTTITRVWILL